MVGVMVNLVAYKKEVHNTLANDRRGRWGAYGGRMNDVAREAQPYRSSSHGVMCRVPNLTISARLGRGFGLRRMSEVLTDYHGHPSPQAEASQLHFPSLFTQRDARQSLRPQHSRVGGLKYTVISRETIGGHSTRASTTL